MFCRKLHRFHFFFWRVLMDSIITGLFPFVLTDNVCFGFMLQLYHSSPFGNPPNMLSQVSGLTKSLLTHVAMIRLLSSVSPLMGF